MFHVDVVWLKRDEQKSIRLREGHLEKSMARTPELKQHLKSKTGQTLQLTPFRTIF